MREFHGQYQEVILSLLAGREYKINGENLNCCCPFHDDKHPSFGINLQTGAYQCFSCEEKGSITDFVAKMLNIGRTAAYNLTKEGHFKIVRISNSIRISKKSFDEWLDHLDT